MEIEYLEDRIEDLLQIYKKETSEYLNQQKKLKSQQAIDPNDFHMVYEKEKQYLDKLIKDFVDLLAKFDEFQSSNRLNEQVRQEKEKFESDFVKLNCEIQQIRSNNETLLDEIKRRDEALKQLNLDINQKGKLIRLLEDKITKMKGKK